MIKPNDPRKEQREQLLIGVRDKYKYEEQRQVLDYYISKYIKNSTAERAFTSDIPIRLSDKKNEDKFGFSQLAEELKNIVLDTYLQMPFTLCIDGYWGSGKTSLARLIYDLLLYEDTSLREGCLPLWVDTSLIPTSNDVLPFFARQLYQEAFQVAQRITISKEDKLGFITSFVPVTFVPAGIKDYDNDLEEKRIRKTLEEYAGEWLKKWKQIPFQEWNFEIFRTLIRETRAALLGGGGLSRIVWFIDDLDRCEADTIVRILQLHRTLLEEWGVVLIYAMDYKIIASVIGEHFLNQGGKYDPHERKEQWDTPLLQGQMYLEKFFSERIRPPEPTEEKLRDWLIEELGPDCYFEGLDEFVRLAFFNNPRYMKDFINAVRFLKYRYHAIKVKAKGTDWEGLIELAAKDEIHALKVLTKITAFALSHTLNSYYETVRYPSAFRLLELESEAERYGAFQITSDDGEIKWVPIPYELRILFSKGPRFEDTNPPSALESAILVIEPMLPPPRIRSRRALFDRHTSSVEKIATDVKEGSSRVISQPTITEKEKVGQIVFEWLSELQNRSVISEDIYKELRRILIRTAPDLIVELFRYGKPNAMDLVVAGENTMLQQSVEDGLWALCSACIHPDCSTKEILRIGNFIDSLTFSTPSLKDRILTLTVMLFEVSTTRYPDDEVLLSDYAWFLAHSQKKNEMIQGLELCLKLLGVESHKLATDEVNLDDKFDKSYFINTFYSATYALQALNRNKDLLHLCEAAIRAPSGVKKTSVITNLAQALVGTGEDKMAEKLLHAVVAKDSLETRVYKIAINLAKNFEGKLRWLLLMIARDPGNAYYWEEVGILIHQGGIREQATDWLKNALALEPQNNQYRNNVVVNLRETYNVKDAEILSNKEYKPEFDNKLLDQAKRAHKDFIRDIILTGKVEYKVQDDVIVLFDPDNLPSWIEEQFGKWSPSASNFIETNLSVGSVA